TPEDEYRVTRRGGKGVFTARLNESTGHVVAVKAVTGEEDIMLSTEDGILIRTPVKDISVTGRNTQGVQLIRIQDDEKVANVTKTETDEEGEEEHDKEADEEVFDRIVEKELDDPQNEGHRETD